MKTLILGALDEEIEGIRAAMKNISAVRAGAFDAWRGFLGAHEVLLCRSGVGKVNASAAASALLALNCDVCAVINTGVAGGIGEGMARGDVVIGTRCVQHDFDQTPDGLRKGQINGFDSEFFDCDSALSDAMEKALTAERIKYHKGIIASGDQFIADPLVAKRLYDEFGAISCEMESAAIAHVCALYGVPFVALRAVSDNGGDGAMGSFYEFLHKAAANNVRALIRYFSTVN